MRTSAGPHRIEGSEQAGLRFDLGGAGVEVHWRAMLQGVRAGEQVEDAIDLLRGPEDTGRGEHHAAMRFRRIDSREIDGGALAGVSPVDGRVVDLQAPDAGALGGRVQFDFIVNGEGPGDQGPGDHRAVAAHREAAVNRQPRMARGVFPGDRVGRMLERGAQIVETGSCGGADGDDGRTFEKRSVDVLLHFKTHQADQVGIDQIGLGERDDAVADTQQAADVEMLAGLGLDGFVGGDDQQNQVDAGDPREHVLDETLMTGNVDESETAEVGEAKVDGDAAAFFFFQPIGVDPG